MTGIPKTVVELGIPGRIEMTNGDVWNFPKKHKFALTCDPSGSRLFIFPAKKKNSSIPDTNTNNKAIALFEKWSRWNASKASKANLPNKKLSRLGKVSAITYYSEKFSRDGKKRGYIHHFNYPPTVSADSRASPSVFRISGGKLKITSRGIEG